MEQKAELNYPKLDIERKNVFFQGIYEIFTILVNFEDF